MLLRRDVRVSATDQRAARRDPRPARRLSPSERRADRHARAPRRAPPHASRTRCSSGRATSATTSSSSWRAWSRWSSGYGGDERLIAVHGPGRFLGELGLLTGQAALFTAVVREPGEVLVVPVERLRELISQDSALGDLILRAYLLRREMLIGLGAGFTIVGSRYSPDTRRLREFCARNRLPHRWIDLEEDQEAEALLRELGVTPEETPVVIWRGREVLRNPSNAELARRIGLRAELAGGHLRPARGGNRAVRACGRRLRRLGGPRDGRARRGRDRWAGRDLVEDRELPRLPVRDLGRGARRARDDPGREVRRADQRAGGGDRRCRSRTGTTS